MPNFYIFIDETGTFSFLDAARNCFIGGLALRDERDINAVLKDLDVLLKNSTNKFNRRDGQKEKLNYPRDMHFSALHSPPHLRFEADKRIQVKPQDISPFFHDVFKKISTLNPLIFRSQGLPAVIPHEQAAYIEVLRNTLLQLLQEKIFNNESTLHIFIAQRRQNILLGYSGTKEPDKYETHLAQQLREELLALNKTTNITITFASARKNTGLMLADFFCGALKNGGYLHNMQESIVRYPFTAGFRLVKLNIQERLDYLRQHNPVVALMWGIQHCSVIAKKQTRLTCLKALREIYDQCAADEKDDFYNNIRGYLNTNLTRKSSRYEFLDEADAIMKILLEILPQQPDDMSNEELRLRTDLGLHRLRVASHRGSVDQNLITAHLHFLQNHAGRSFLNRLEYLQHLVDATLIVAQVQDFNNLNFIDVEKTITPVRDLYHRVFEVLAPTGIPFDENLAKLEGTSAQMCGFLYELTGDVAYYQRAEQGLINDIASCRPLDHAWEQGMGFLTALYWKQGDFAKAQSQFFKEINANSPTDIYNLDAPLTYDPSAKPFFLLHHLYLCALAQKNGETIVGLDTITSFLLKSPRVAKYPEMLSVKWLAVLHINKGNYNQALELLQKNEKKPPLGDEFTIGFIRLPIKMLAHKCRLQLGEKSDFILNKEVDRLEEKREGAKQLLGTLGLGSFSIDPLQWDSYAVASLPPFYYA